MAQGIGMLVLNMGIQGAAQGDIDHLDTAANAQKGFPISAAWRTR